MPNVTLAFEIKLYLQTHYFPFLSISILSSILISVLECGFGEINPLPLLTSRNAEPSSISQVYFDDPIEIINWGDEKYKEVEILFPEELTENHSRFQSFYEGFKESDKGTILIVVTHGLAIESFRKYTDAPKTIINYWWISWAEYDWDDKASKPRWLMNCYSKHIERSDHYQIDKTFGIFVF